MSELTRGEKLALATFWEAHAWTRCAMYRDAEHNECSADAAVKYCSLGAIEAVVESSSARYVAIQLLADSLSIPGGAVTFWNDQRGRTIEEVRAAFKAAFGEDLA